MSIDFAISTQKLGRVYKIRGGKKSEPKTLLALTDVNLEIQRISFRWCEQRACKRGLIDMVTNY